MKPKEEKRIQALVRMSKIEESTFTWNNTVISTNNRIIAMNTYRKLSESGKDTVRKEAFFLYSKLFYTYKGF